MAGSLKENLNRVNEKVQQELQENQSSPLVIAVSKKQELEKIRKLYELGVRDFAENYVQEAKIKIENLKNLKISWHYIGQLQKKKIKDIVGFFEYIHSLDREDVAEKISQKCEELNIKQKVLVQVNIAGEETKQGLMPDDLMAFLSSIKKFKNLEVCGLMIFPPLGVSEEDDLRWFEEGKKLFDEVKSQSGSAFQQLSMGTSQNYHLATRKGATMLRVGESLMGERIN